MATNLYDGFIYHEHIGSHDIVLRWRHKRIGITIPLIHKIAIAEDIDRTIGMTTGHTLAKQAAYSVAYWDIPHFTRLMEFDKIEFELSRDPISQWHEQNVYELTIIMKPDIERNVTLYMCGCKDYGNPIYSSDVCNFHNRPWAVKVFDGITINADIQRNPNEED